MSLSSGVSSSTLGRRTSSPDLDDEDGQSLKSDRPTLSDHVIKKLSRTKEKLRRNLGGADKTEDDYLRMCNEQFQRQQAQVIKLQKALKAYNNSVKTLSASASDLAEVIMDCYEGTWPRRKDCADALQKINEFWLEYAVGLNNQVKAPLNNYVFNASDVKVKVAKLERKLTDYDSARHAYESILSSKKRDESRLRKARDDLFDAEKIYLSMSKELHEELPNFCDQRLLAYSESWEKLFRSGENLFSQMSKQWQILVESVQELEKNAREGKYKMIRQDPETQSLITIGLDNAHRKSSSSYSLTGGDTLPYQTALFRPSLPGESTFNHDLNKTSSLARSGVPGGVGGGGSNHDYWRNIGENQHSASATMTISGYNSERMSHLDTTSPCSTISHHANHRKLPIEFMDKRSRLNQSGKDFGGGVGVGGGGGGVVVSAVNPTVGELSTNSSQAPVIMKKGKHSKSPNELTGTTSLTKKLQMKFWRQNSDNLQNSLSVSSNDLPVNEKKEDFNSNEKKNSLNDLNDMEDHYATLSSVTPSTSAIIRQDNSSPSHGIIKENNTTTIQPQQQPIISREKKKRNIEIPWGGGNKKKEFDGRSESSSSSSILGHRPTSAASSNDKLKIVKISNEDNKTKAEEGDDDDDDDPEFHIYSQINKPRKESSRVNNDNDNGNGSNINNKLVVSYAYEPLDKDELKLTIGEIIQVIPWEDEELKEDGWGFGLQLSTGKRGLFPENHTSPYFRP